MIDIIDQINAVNREVGSRSAGDGEGIGVLLRRRYDAPIEDVWEALTDPDRMKRWFLPVSGDLRVGGDFQLEGNAGGRILRCEPPRLLKVTFGAETSLVELRLSPDGEDATTFELEHTVPLEMAGSGAGALYVGPGWDGALMSLGLFVVGEAGGDPVAAANSPEGQEFSRQSVHAWIAAVEASGTAGAAEIAAAAEVSMAQFAPDVDSAPDGKGNA
ncbi:SRPBCC family protein [Streptosporangium sp. NPDC023825]|uniref:SRPBCC family protein n=1 Tax=Streptosporangium sp. NPDC023825 TaxID=3154909 RepID=UPI003444A110